jgi:hypothetical protein
MNGETDPRSLEADPTTERVVKTEIDERGGPDPEAVSTVVESKGDAPDVKTTLEDEGGAGS